MRYAEIESQVGGYVCSGLAVSEGDNGLRLTLDRQVLPAIIEFSERKHLMVVQYNQMIQAGYDIASGELMAAWIYLNGYWMYSMATQAMIFGTGAVGETLRDMGVNEIVFSLDLASGFQTLAVGIQEGGHLVVLDDALALRGAGSVREPLIGRLGEREVKIVAIWDEDFVRLGVGEGRKVMIMPIARKVGIEEFLENIDKQSTERLIKQALPIILLREEGQES